MDGRSNKQRREILVGNELGRDGCVLGTSQDSPEKEIGHQDIWTLGIKSTSNLIQ